MKFDLTIEASTIINDVSTIDNIGQFSIAIGNLIKGDSGKSPYIDDTTKTWWEYNDTTKEYEDTGIAAKSVDIYNITNEIPLGAGLFYTLSTAITATPVANRKKGLLLMFESGAGVWETYQFKGVIANWSVLGSWSNDLSLKIDKTAIKQDLGDSETDVMSQKAVTDELTELESEIYNVKTFQQTITIAGNQVSPAIPYIIKNGETILVTHSGGNGSLMRFDNAWGGDYITMSGTTGSVQYTATDDIASIYIFPGAETRTITFEIVKNQGLEIYKIQQDYNEKLKFHYGKLNVLRQDFNLSIYSQSEKIPFCAKEGNTFRIYCSGLNSVIAMFAWKTDGSRITLLASIYNEATKEVVIDADIEYIAFVSNESQTCHAIIEVYDAESYINKAALSASMNAGDLPFIVDKTEDFSTGVQRLSNGAIARLRGFDVPLGNTGKSTMIEFHLPKISNDCDCYFECITNLPASNFSTDWSNGITQESANIVRFKIGKSINTQYSTHRCIVNVKVQNDTSKAWYLRLSKIIIYPQTPDAYKKAIQRLGCQKERTLIEICQDFTESTTGYGEYRFQSLISAVSAMPPRGNLREQTFRIMPGIYDDFASEYPVVSGEGSGTRGIKTKVGQTFESFDIYNPELTILKWDGHEGLAENVRLTALQAMSRCIFHVDEAWDSEKGLTLIQGLKIVAANVRYCIHPESSGYAVGKKWEIKHCILEWNGCPYVDGYQGRHIGIGLSAGESGLVEDVYFTGQVIAGIGGHDNAFRSGRLISTPQYLSGCELHIKGCNLGGGTIYMNTFGNTFENINTILIENCTNIEEVVVGFEAGTQEIKQRWKYAIVNSDVAEGI